MTEEQREKFALAAVCFTYTNEYEKIESGLLKELFDAALSSESHTSTKLKEQQTSAISAENIVLQGTKEEGEPITQPLKISKCCNVQAVTSRKFGAGYYECMKCGTTPCEIS